MPYEVLSDALTIHKDVRVLKDQQGNVTGRQLGLGKTYLKGEVIADDQVGQVYKDILDGDDSPTKEKLERKLKKVSSEPKEDTAARLGIPFAGYEDMDEDSIVAAMKHLPSATIQRIKQYEQETGGNRDKIVHYSVGFGTDPDARQEGRVGSEVAEEGDRDVEPEDKETAKLTTRSVPGVDDDAGDEGTVVHGDGFTGTGEGARPYGSQKEAEGDGDSKGAKPAARRSRRSRSSG